MVAANFPFPACVIYSQLAGYSYEQVVSHANVLYGPGYVAHVLRRLRSPSLHPTPPRESTWWRLQPMLRLSRKVVSWLFFTLGLMRYTLYRIKRDSSLLPL
jgi:hypothetical protein